MIVVVRATQSPGLFMQIVGRGTRLYEGKDVCHVLDYGSNIERFGPIDSPSYGADFIKDPSAGDGEAPTKVCPSCFEIVHASVMRCKRCGYDFPKREKELKSTMAAITSKPSTRKVESVRLSRWKGKKLDDGSKKPDTILAEYRLLDENDSQPSDGFNTDSAGVRRVREWLCVEHTGYARQKFEQWWTARSWSSPPETIDEALLLDQKGALATTDTVTMRPDGRFLRITKTVPGERPPRTTYELEEGDQMPF